MVDVARHAGISVETLRKIEGGRIPSAGFFTVSAIAATLDLSLDDLLERVNRTTPHGGPTKPVAV